MLSQAIKKETKLCSWFLECTVCNLALVVLNLFEKHRIYMYFLLFLDTEVAQVD